MVEVGGRFGSVLRLLPPLVVTTADVDAIAERLLGAIRAAEDQRGTG